MCKSNQTSQDFLLDQLKHYSEAVIAIKNYSISTRPSSSQAMEYCPSLTPYRTTKLNNVTALGYKCLEHPRSSTHECQGNELGTSQLTSLRLGDSIPETDRLHVTITIDQVSHYSTYDESLITMSSIGGQQEVISVPGEIEGIEKPVKGASNDSIAMYNPTVTSIRSKEEFRAMKRAYYTQSSPPPLASATMDPANYPRVQTPAATMYAPPCNCLFSPSAPQVENYVPGTFSLADCAGTTSPRVKDAGLAKVIEENIMIKSIQTCSTACTGALIILPSLDISDSKEEYLQAMATTKRSRASKPSAARKIIITTPRGRGDPRTSLDVDPRSARRQAREAMLQPSNIESSPSSASMSPSTMTAARSTSTSSLPDGGTAADEDSDTMPDLMPSSDDEDLSTN